MEPTQIATPAIDASTLPDGISTTFTFTCSFGCIVRVVAGQEQAHVCVGEQVIAAASPELDFAAAKRVASSIKPLINQLTGDAWTDGVHSGRRGPCAGVD